MDLANIKAWVLKEGFPLEMRAAAEMRAAGFSVFQGRYYTDPDTAKAREIDVLAIAEDNFGVFQFTLAVECKSTQNGKPWLLFTSPDVYGGYNRLRGMGLFSQRLGQVLASRVLDLRDNVSWFTPVRPVAYSLRQAHTQRLDVAHAAVSSCFAAGVSTALSGSGGGWRFCVPVLVVDAPLLTVSLGKTEELVVEEIDHGLLLHSPGQQGCLVHVVAAAVLPRFASEAYHAFGQLKTLLSKEIDAELGVGPSEPERAT